MKLATVQLGSREVVVIIDKERAIDARAAVAACVSGTKAMSVPDSLLDCLRGGDDVMDLLRKAFARVGQLDTKELPAGSYLGSTHGVKLLPPISSPGKMICLAGNYAEHIEETNPERAPEKETTNPWLFTKPVNSGLIGHGDPILIPKVWDRVDWEAELAVVIGRQGKYISAADAQDYIAGYTVFNDITGRGLNLAPQRVERGRDKFFDWFHGKQFDSFASMGPWMIDRAAVEDVQDLRITLTVNGEVKQDSTTRKMVFYVSEIVEFASQIMTLYPGDIIATGTPAGIGAPRGQFLKAGDVVEATIEDIGTLRNPVENES